MNKTDITNMINASDTDVSVKSNDLAHDKAVVKDYEVSSILSALSWIGSQRKFSNEASFHYIEGSRDLAKMLFSPTGQAMICSDYMMLSRLSSDQLSRLSRASTQVH